MQQSKFDDEVLLEVPQWPVAFHLDDVPTAAEIQRAVNQMSTGKSPGIDGIPAQIFKHCSSHLPHLVELVELIWTEASDPQDFKDAQIVHCTSTCARESEPAVIITEGFHCCQSLCTKQPF